MQCALSVAGATGCRLTRAGGDCVAVQAGLGQPGRRRRLPARNVTAMDVSCSAPQGAALRLGPQLQGGTCAWPSAFGLTRYT